MQVENVKKEKSQLLQLESLFGCSLGVMHTFQIDVKDLFFKLQLDFLQRSYIFFLTIRDTLLFDTFQLLIVLPKLAFSLENMFIVKTKTTLISHGFQYPVQRKIEELFYLCC